MNEYYLEVISERIRLARQRAGLTQKEFAERLGISKRTIETLEKAKNGPSAYVLFMIAYKFRVSANWILGVTEKVEA